MANSDRLARCRYCGHNEPHFGSSDFNCRFGPPRVWDADPAKRTDFACPCKQYAPMTPAQEFFFTQAGYSYDPKTETESQGRARHAVALAAAELRALDAGWGVDWTPDEQLADYQDNEGQWHSAPAMVASLYDTKGDIIGSLGGIIESEDTAERLAYRRVVNAELASQQD